MSSTQRSNFWRRALGYPLIFGLGYVAFCALLGYTYVNPRRFDPGPIYVRQEGTFGVAELAGSIQGSQKVVLLLHGYGGSPDEWAGVQGALQLAGVPSLALHMRGHALSPHGTVTFGVREAEDLLALSAWVRERAPAAEQVWVGRSMGGATVWRAASRSRVRPARIITDGAYIDLQEVAFRWLDQISPGLRPVLFFGGVFAGVDPGRLQFDSDARALRGTPCDVFHGAADSLVPADHARRYALAAGCTLHLKPGLGHVEAMPDEVLLRAILGGGTLPQ